MNDEIARWVKMLTGTLGNVPDPEVLSLEESCRTLEAQIESLHTHRDPQQQAAELEKLEACVSKLGGREAQLKNDCACLEQQLRNTFEQLRTAALAGHEALSQRKLTSDAAETVRRASDFFGIDFSAMTPAQMGATPRIARKLSATRKTMGERISQAHGVLEQHPAVREHMKEREVELAALNREIAEFEQLLGTHHHVQPDVLAALHNFTADQLAAYRDEFIHARLNDARLERARGLTRNDLLEVAQ